MKVVRKVSMAQLKVRARRMRKNMTPAEKIVWSVVRRWPVRVLPQRILYPFIVDFYAPTEGLVVELDGGVHAWQREKDARRSVFLAQRYGVRVVRFTNRQVFDDLNVVLDTIEWEVGLR